MNGTNLVHESYTYLEGPFSLSSCRLQVAVVPPNGNMAVWTCNQPEMKYEKAVVATSYIQCKIIWVFHAVALKNADLDSKKFNFKQCNYPDIIGLKNLDSLDDIWRFSGQWVWKTPAICISIYILNFLGQVEPYIFLRRRKSMSNVWSPWKMFTYWYLICTTTSSFTLNTNIPFLMRLF